MDWQYAINRNRSALVSIVMAMMKSLGLVSGGALTSLPFHLHRRVLLFLRPAEAAVRRLIMMAAYDMELRGIKVRKPQTPDERPASAFPNAANFAPSFNLIDPLKTFGSETPDYAFFDAACHDEHSATNRTPVPAAALGRRLLALHTALNNLQKQARRLTRWYAQRDLALQQAKPHRLSPLRPGYPPGWRKKPLHPVENILLDCHSLAQHARERRDSS